MDGDKPQVILIAGPNGAGKSTAAPKLLAETLGIVEFVNADAIAQGLSAFNPEGVAVQAGRIMLQRLHQLADQRRNFAFETTLASKSFAPWIRELHQNGYEFHLLFLWLPCADLAAARVQERVRMGGHDIPVETIRRRYQVGLKNFFHLYQSMTDWWYFYDNSSKSEPRLLASGRGILEETVEDPQTWASIKKEIINE